MLLQNLSIQDVHLFRYQELAILLDVNSGAVHLLDEIAYDLLRDLLDGKPYENTALKHGQAAVDEALRQFEQLQEQGLLANKFELDTKAFEEQSAYIKSLCLHVSHDCDLRCRYCFAGTGGFGGRRQLMDCETARRAVDFLLEASGPRRFCEIDFFGGEPLLNFPVVKETVHYARRAAAAAEKEMALTLTTNGMGLEPQVRRFLKDEGIKLVLSLDGRPEVNDRMRPTREGTGSHDRVRGLFGAMVGELGGKDYFIRGTYTRYNRDFSRDIAHMLDCGFKELSVEPVVAPAGAAYALTEEDLPVLCEQYDRLVDLYLEHQQQGEGFNFFHFNLNLNRGPCLPKRLRGCGAGFEYLAVTPQGQLYPCHQFVGEQDYYLGDVWQGITEPQVSSRFRRTHVFNKEECSRCWARFLCSGGCNANAYQQNGDLLKPYRVGCRIQKKRLECALYLEARRLLAEN